MVNILIDSFDTSVDYIGVGVKNYSIFLFGAIMAGYLVAHFPASTLQWVKNPIGKFIVFLALAFAYGEFTTKPSNMVNYFVSAFIATLVLQGVEFSADKYDDWVNAEKTKRERELLQQQNEPYFSRTVRGE